MSIVGVMIDGPFRVSLVLRRLRSLSANGIRAVHITEKHFR